MHKILKKDTEKVFYKHFKIKLKKVLTTPQNYAIIVFVLKRYRRVEQLVARRAHNPEVVGSSPAPAPNSESRPFRFAFFFASGV